MEMDPTFHLTRRRFLFRLPLIREILRTVFSSPHPNPLPEGEWNLT